MALSLTAGQSHTLESRRSGAGRSGTEWQPTATCPSTRVGQLASQILHQGEFPVLLQIDERDHQLLLEVLGSAMLTLREVDTAGYEAMRQEREAVMVSLRERLLAQA